MHPRTTPVVAAQYPLATANPIKCQTGCPQSRPCLACSRAGPSHVGGHVPVGCELQWKGRPRRTGPAEPSSCHGLVPPREYHSYSCNSSGGGSHRRPRSPSTGARSGATSPLCCLARRGPSALHCGCREGCRRRHSNLSRLRAGARHLHLQRRRVVPGCSAYPLDRARGCLAPSRRRSPRQPGPGEGVEPKITDSHAASQVGRTRSLGRPYCTP